MSASGTQFSHEAIILDGADFADCEFRDCRLIYAGGEAPSFSNCRFHGCDWKFEAAAARTLAQLKQVWGLGGKANVQALIKEITAAA